MKISRYEVGVYEQFLPVISSSCLIILHGDNHLIDWLFETVLMWSTCCFFDDSKFSDVHHGIHVAICRCYISSFEDVDWRSRELVWPNCGEVKHELAKRG